MIIETAALEPGKAPSRWIPSKPIKKEGYLLRRAKRILSGKSSHGASYDHMVCAQSCRFLFKLPPSPPPKKKKTTHPPPPKQKREKNKAWFFSNHHHPPPQTIKTEVSSKSETHRSGQNSGGTWRPPAAGSFARRRSAMVPARKHTWPTYWMMQPEASANLNRRKTNRPNPRPTALLTQKLREEEME